MSILTVLGGIGLVVLVGAGVVAVLLGCWQQEAETYDEETPRKG